MDTSLACLKDSAKGPVALTVHEAKRQIAGFALTSRAHELRAGIFSETINGVTVPAVAVMARLEAGRRLLIYGGWINDLAPDGKDVLKALAAQEEIVIQVVSRTGKVFASATTPNTVQDVCAEAFWLASKLRKKAGWTAHHFAAARAFVESQFPTSLDLWQQLQAPPDQG